MEKLDENEYIVKTLSGTYIKITVVGNTVLWYHEREKFWMCQYTEDIYKIENWKVLLKTINESSQRKWGSIEYLIKNWKICKKDEKSIKYFSQLIQWHETVFEDAADFIRNFADKYKIFEMGQEKFVGYYHKNPKKINKKGNDNALLNWLFLLPSLPLLVVFIWCPIMILRFLWIWLVMWFIDNILKEKSFKWQKMSELSKDRIWMVVCPILTIIIFVYFYYIWKYDFWWN